jgi:outer membrane protein
MLKERMNQRSGKVSKDGENMNNYVTQRKFFLLCWRVILQMLLVCGLVTSAWTLTITDAYHSSLSNDPGLKRAGFEHAASREIKKQALSEFLPQLGVTGEYLDTDQDIVSSDNDVFASGSSSYPTTNYDVSLSQPLFHYETWVQYRQAKKELLYADVAYSIASQEMMIKVSELYFAVLAARDAVVSAAAEKKAVEKHFFLAKAKHESGQAAVTDLYDAKARLSQVMATEIEAKYLLEDAVTALQEMTGPFDEKISGLKADIALVTPDPDAVEIWIETARNTNLALIHKKYAVAVADEEVSKQRAGHYPTLDLSARYNYNKTEGSLFGGGSEVDTQEVGIMVNLPIYQGGYINSKTRQALQMLNAAKADLDLERRAVERLVSSSFFGVQTAILRTQALKASVEAHELAAEAKLEGFKSNLYPILAYLDAERDLEIVRQEYARARYDYILSSLKLKQAAGTLSGKDMESLATWFN